MFRDFAKFLRGSHAPIQIFLAAVLGSLIGFAPGFSVAPMLIVLLVLALIVLNAPIGIALLVAGLTKLLAMLSMAISFGIGEWILDGPPRPLMEWAVNAPILALCGLDRYAVSGGLVLGLVVGVVSGWFLVTTLGAFRRKMSGLEENSDRYKKLTSNPFMKCLLWLLVGKGHGKATYGELLSKKQRRPFRVMGVVITALLLGAIVFAPGMFSGVITKISHAQLESMNGATVDLESVELDVDAGRLVVRGLAMADPNALGTNLFEAAELEANISSSDLLRGRLAIDRVSIIEGAQGLLRASPGELVGPPPRPRKPPEPRAGEDDSKTLEEIFEDAQKWRDRLATAREWLERFSGGEDEESPETLEERLEREVAEKGWVGVVARGLAKDAPSLLIRELVAEGVRSSSVEGETLAVRFDNLSTDPGLVDAPARLRIDSSGGKLQVDISLGGASAGQDANRLLFALNGVATDEAAAGLIVDGQPLLSGGTLDLRLDGFWSGGQVGQLDLPLDVSFHGVELALGSQRQTLDGLSLPISLRGPLDAPRITLDDDALKDILEGALRAELDSRVGEKQAELQEKVDEKLDEKKDELKEKLGDKLGDKLGGLLGGKKKD